MWRMGKVDYVSAVAQAGERVALEGKPLPTPWDLRLRSAMTSADPAVHEEAVAGLLPGHRQLPAAGHRRRSFRDRVIWGQPPQV